MVAVSDFSGLASSACAFASAAAIAPIVSLDPCMARLHVEKIEADRARLGAFGANDVSRGFLSVLGHQPFQLRLGALVSEEGGAGRSEQAGDFSPGIGFAHVDDSHRLDSRLWGFDAERSRRFAELNAAPELSLGGNQEMLIERIGGNGDLDPLPPPVMMDSTAELGLITHILCCNWAMCFSPASSSENDHG